MAHSGKNTLMLLDILVQIGLVLLASFNVRYLLLFVFIGGAWQLISNFCHLQFSHECQKTRRVYQKWAKWVLIVLFISGIVAIIATGEWLQILVVLALVGLFISLVGGMVLYIVYLCISIAHFVSLNHKGTAHEIC